MSVCVCVCVLTCEQGRVGGGCVFGACESVRFKDWDWEWIVEGVGG
jgi:hypothetical protein